MDSLKKIVPEWARKIANTSILRYRQINWRNRQLPGFIIIGAQKSGTSSLFSYLSQHPHLIPSYKKEVHYFDGGLNPDVDNFNKGLSWYQSHFPLKQHCGNNQITFEASPLYLYNPLVPQRISGLNPEVKLIAILRHPVERAISHYFHEKRNNRESLPVLEAFQSEEERLKPIIDKQDYKNDSFIRQSYKSRGLYYEQLVRYLEHFSMSSILVINSELLFTQPEIALRNVFEFVGVDPDFAIKDLRPRNVGDYRSKVGTDAYEYLIDYFEPHNQKLYELIGVDYGW